MKTGAHLIRNLHRPATNAMLYPDEDSDVPLFLEGAEDKSDRKE